MQELYYGLFKKQTTEQLIYTLIAESVVYNYTRIVAQRIKLDQGAYNRTVRRVLFDIKIGKLNYIDAHDTELLEEYFRNLLLIKNYIVYMPIIGFHRTVKFKKQMKSCAKNINQDIRKYIETSDVKYLGRINPEICEIEIRLLKNGKK